MQSSLAPTLGAYEIYGSTKQYLCVVVCVIEKKIPACTQHSPNVCFPAKFINVYTCVCECWCVRMGQSVKNVYSTFRNSINKHTNWNEQCVNVSSQLRTHTTFMHCYSFFTLAIRLLNCVHHPVCKCQTVCRPQSNTLSYGSTLN